MDEVERALEVDRDDCIPLGLGHSQHESVFGYARIVDKDVYRAELLLDLLNHLFGLCKVGSIAGVSLHFHSLGGNLGLGGLAVIIDNEVCECDVCTFFSKLERYGLAYAARSSGNQSCLT